MVPVPLEELRNLAIASVLDCYAIQIDDPSFIVYNDALITTAGYCEWEPWKVLEISLNPKIKHRRQLLEVFAHELSHGIQVVLEGETYHNEDFYEICRAILKRFGLYNSEPFRLHAIYELAQLYKPRV